MRSDVVEFWQRNNTPIALMMQKAPAHGLLPQQVRVAATVVYEEMLDIVENVPEIKPYMNGKELEKIVLFRNQLKPNILGWRVYTVAKFVELDEETKKPIQQKKNIITWLKSIKWEINPWQ